MKRTMTTAALAAGLAAMTTGAFAADWIETVELTRDGIDATPIEVAANAQGYTGIKTSAHRFLFRLHARATNGERIVAMKLGAFHGVRYFEADGSLWSKSYAHRDVGSGSRRTVTIGDKPVIPVGKLKWQMVDPVMACNSQLSKEMNKGTSRNTALAKAYNTSVGAYFELDAVAARKNKATGNNWGIKNTTDQRDGYVYQVPVRCLPGVKPPRAGSGTPSRVKAN